MDRPSDDYLATLTDKTREYIAQLEDTNRRLNRRCQEAEAMATEFRHAANALRTVAGQIAETGVWAAHWLNRLRALVRAGECVEAEPDEVCDGRMWHWMQTVLGSQTVDEVGEVLTARIFKAGALWKVGSAEQEESLSVECEVDQ